MWIIVISKYINPTWTWREDHVPRPLDFIKSAENDIQPVEKGKKQQDFF